MYSFQGTFLVILFDSSFSISSRAEFSTSARASLVWVSKESNTVVPKSIFHSVEFQCSLEWCVVVCGMRTLLALAFLVVVELPTSCLLIWAAWLLGSVSVWSSEEILFLLHYFWKSPLKSIELFSNANVEVTWSWPTTSCETFPLALLVYF